MLVDRIDALRAALVAGDIATADRIAAEIEAEALTGAPPDPHALQRAVGLLQAAVAGLRAAGERLAVLRGTSSVYDAQGRLQRHAAAPMPARRW